MIYNTMKSQQDLISNKSEFFYAANSSLYMNIYKSYCL